MSDQKTYLGDSIYYDRDVNGVVLTTENGVSISNRIYMGSEEVHAFLAALCRDFGRDTIVAALPSAYAENLEGSAKHETTTDE